MTPEDLLSEIRDIDQPVEPGWWLMSTFWQLVITVLLAGLAAGWLYRARQQKNRRVREAQQRLAHIRNEYQRHADPGNTLISLSAWLKQVAMAAFPEQHVGALTGKAWMDFLQATSATPVFDAEQQQLLTAELYRRHIECDLNPTLEACERWLAEIDGALKRARSA